MVLELLSHLMSFDFVWVAGLVLNNLHWVFAIFAYVFISDGGKKPVWLFLSTIILLYAFVDFFDIAGWVFVPIGLFLIIQFVMTIFFENTSLEKHYLKLVVVVFVVLSFIQTFYFDLPWAG